MTGPSRLPTSRSVGARTIGRASSVLVARWRPRFGAPLFGGDAVETPGGFDGKCRHGFGPLGPRRQNWRSHDPKPHTSRGEPLGSADSASPRRHQWYYAAEIQAVLRQNPAGAFNAISLAFSVG